VLAGRVGEGLGGRAEKVLEVAIGERERERGRMGNFLFLFFEERKGMGNFRS
jgi:hypothetical protein